MCYIYIYWEGLAQETLHQGQVSAGGTRGLLRTRENIHLKLGLRVWVRRLLRVFLIFLVSTCHGIGRHIGERVPVLPGSDRQRTTRQGWTAIKSNHIKSIMWVFNCAATLSTSLFCFVCENHDFRWARSSSYIYVGLLSQPKQTPNKIYILAYLASCNEVRKSDSAEKYRMKYR